MVPPLGHADLTAPVRRLAGFVALVAGVLLVAGALARSAVARRAAWPGPTSFSVGLVDDPTFLDPSEAETVRGAWFARAERISAGWVRLGVYWQFIAPARPEHPTNPDDPGYFWTATDAAVRDAAAHRVKLLLQLGYPPDWALGHRPPKGVIPNTWRPSATLFGQFARVVASRYSGRYPDPLRPHHRLPRVTTFQIWNEPNLRINLSPQWTRDRRGRPIPASPGIYRALLNAGYANVKAVQRHATVLAAGLGPYGDPPGVDRMRPVAFMRDLLCLSGQALRREQCPRPAHFDAVDDHPYSATPTTHAFNRDDVSVPDLGRLTHVVTVAVRRRTLLPRARKSAWMTEIFWPSKPPDPAGIPLVQQARRLSLTFYELWRQGVGHMFWYLIRDYPHKSESGAGLFFASGRPKPSSVAFHFPFAAVRDARGITTVWGRAPRRGVVTIQRATRHGWRTLLRRGTTAGGVFYTRTALPRHLLLRARIGQFASISYPEG